MASAEIDQVTAAQIQQPEAIVSKNRTTQAIHAFRMRKRFGATEAVREIDINVAKGEIFGLIGPDGAGKTTTFQILAGVMEATSGSVQIFGRPARDARSETGYLTQAFSLYPDLSVMQNIRYVGDLRRIPSAEITKRGLRYLEMFDMHRFRDRLAGRLSGGMKQKLALACALVPEPRVLLLDEPTTGVDPVSRREFWDVLVQLTANGLTIMVATPYLDEAERCHRVALMHKGEIHQTGTPSELRASLHAKRLELRTSNLTDAEKYLRTERNEGKLIFDVQRFGDRLDVLTDVPDAATQYVRDTLKSAHIEVIDIRTGEPTLENIFVAKLRSLGQEAQPEAFPDGYDHKKLRGQVAIGAKDLTKRFGSFDAVKPLNIEIRYGEVYGLLGANGAGKTTAIKMLCGLLAPTSGEMTLAGQTGNLRSRDIRQRIGYMSQKFSLYDDLSIEENLNFFAGIYGVPKSKLASRRHWALAFSGLNGKEALLTGSLPGGWKQRVALVAAIMHEPSVLFLDEPTSGVDPLARRAFWSVINQLADRGAAILVTTHYLEEAEQCNRLGFMVAGELVSEGSPTEIKSWQAGHLIEFTVDQPQLATEVLKKTSERWRVSLFGDRLHVTTDESPDKGIQATTVELAKHNICVLSAREKHFSLEDVFIGIVEKARQAGKVASEN